MKPSFTFSLSHEGVKNAWDDVDGTVAKLIDKLVYSTDWATDADWTKVESTEGNVTLSDGVWSMNGNNSWGANGIYKTTGVPCAVGCMQVKFKGVNNINFSTLCTIIQKHSAAELFANTTDSIVISSLGRAIHYSNSVAQRPFTEIKPNTLYTVRMYIKRTTTGLLGRGIGTIQGGVFSKETTIFESDNSILPIAQGDPMYPIFQRRANSAANPSQWSEFRWFSGFETDGSTYLRCKADAGTGSMFFNFDPSALRQPLSTTGLKYRWAFTNDDADPAMSEWLTLAEIQAVAKQIGSYRYIIIDVQQNSDGEYNPLATLSCTDTLTEGIDKTYPVFNISPNVGSVDGGTTVTLNFPDGGANLLTGVTFGGTAGTDLTIVNDNQATVKTPAKTASQVDVTGSFSGGYADYTITGGFTFQAGAAAPGAFTLSASARQGEVLLTWTPAAKFDYFQVYQDNVLIKNNLSDSVSWLVTGLTGGQSYDFYVKAVNGVGETQSNTVSIKPIAAGVLPENTVIKELLETLRSQVLAIKDASDNPVFSNDNTVIGWIVDITTRESANFPCCEIYPTGNGSQGNEYLSQREISTDYTFEIVAHQYYGTPSRDTGVDLYDINKIGEAIRQQVYRLNDLSQAGSDPCTGFIQVNPSFSVRPEYELFSKEVNSAIISFSIRADNPDIGI